jgi:hypothetical protein
MYPAYREEDDLIVLRELAAKPMRKLGPLEPYVERLKAQGLARRTRAGWTVAEVGLLVLERVGKALH